MDLQIHLGQRFMHVLHVDRGALDQAGAMPAQGAYGADLAVGTEGALGRPTECRYCSHWH